MTAELSRIPGAGPTRRPALFRHRLGRRTRADDGHRTSSLRDPRRAAGADRRVWHRPRRHVPYLDLLIALGFLAVFGFLAMKAWEATRVPVEVTGVADGDELTLEEAEALDVEVTIEPSESLDEARFTVNGEVPDSETVTEVADGFRWTPPPLDEGTYELALSAPRPLLSEADFSWSFVVDGTPPEIEVPVPYDTVGVCEELTATGTVEPGVELTADGQEVDVDGDGSFALDFDRPPAHPVQLVATDEAGNRSGAEVIVPVEYPAAQGLHVTAAAWNHLPLRNHVLDIVERGLVSVVELDLKDEGGIVGYDTNVALAHTVGAVRDLYDLDEAVSRLRSEGVRVVGRVVAFRDAPLANWAWEHGRRDMVVQDGSGGMLGSYGGFTNFAHPDVRQYNLDIALEGIDAGMDDILWDYVRRPEGAIEDQVFPGLEGSPEDGVTEFLAFTGAALRDRCAYQGASVFGIAADRPWAVGQDVGRVARHVDYVAPMLYPSHWVNGEYGVDNPNQQPYDITKAALADFQAKAEGTGVTMVPWIQDFTYGYPYGPEEVRAQIDAAADLGVSDWLLWNASVTYTPEALEPGLVTSGAS